MKCQFCTQPATVHLTDIEPGGQKKEVHLCQACAEKKKVFKKQELHLPSILQMLIGAHVSPRAEELSRLTCPVCGIKYMEFRAQGRLGCPNDYEVFKTDLEPLLQRIHRAGHHVGKSPKNKEKNANWQKELLDLRRQLREAIDTEAYEKAAKLRDIIRQKERQG